MIQLKIVLHQIYNMSLNPHLLNQSTNIFDFCQQCQCFHQAYYQNGQLIMFPCESSISSPNIDEKITSDTNITSPTVNESINSVSSMSINNHLSPTVRPKSIKPNKQVKNVYGIQDGFLRPQVYSSKSPQTYSPHKRLDRPTSIRSNQSSHHKITVNQYPINIREQSKPVQQQKPFSFYNTTKIQPSQTLIRNTSPNRSIISSSHPITNSKPLSPIHTVIIPSPSRELPFQTPQFGSQSRISQNKQNTMSPRRLLAKEQKQFIIPKITQGRTQRALSQEQSDTFCCGYIRKG